MEPKMYFNSDAEMFACLEDWKQRLGLSDWWIACRICKAEDMKLEGVAGESEVQHVNRCGLISLLCKEELPRDMILKQPHEQTLIHELLHFKFMMIDNESYESMFLCESQHALLEDIAKALYMAKYNLGWSWFIETAHRISKQPE